METGAMIKKIAPALLIVLAGCASKPALYEWGSYQPQLYAYFQAEGGFEVQLIALEVDLQKMRAVGKNPPPGFHAHLGLLYSHLGKVDQMVQAFRTEKALYPESGAYMDFLLKKAVKP